MRVSKFQLNIKIFKTSQFAGAFMRGGAESLEQMPVVKANSDIYKGNEAAETEDQHPWAVGSSWDDGHRGSIWGFSVIQE